MLSSKELAQDSRPHWALFPQKIVDLARTGLVVLALVVGLAGSPGFGSLSSTAAAWVEPQSQDATARDQAPDSSPSIWLDLNQISQRIPAQAFGLPIPNQGNDAPELAYLLHTVEGQQKLQEIGARLLNYSTDQDDWQHPYNPYTAEPVTYPAWLDTNEFLKLSTSIGSEPTISVNITMTCKQRDPLLPASIDNVTCAPVTSDIARDWLAFIKAQGIARVRYVQLGQEPYAGCMTWWSPDGINCTAKFGMHRIALTQDEYAKRAVEWAKALRSVDPSIKLGLHLQPNTFLCTQDCGGMEWDHRVLQKAGGKIDFVITHQYFTMKDPAADNAAGQKLSYYQEQQNMRITKNGVTAMPQQIRKELLKWAPDKSTMPIVIGEYNAALMDYDSDAANVAVRMSLYAGMSVAEGYLDMLSPVQVGGQTLPGASQVFIHNLQSLPAMLVHYLPLDNPQTLVYSPTWYMMAALRDFQGKTWLIPTVKANVSTPVGRPALRVYAAKAGKHMVVAVFNHATDQPFTSKVMIAGMRPVSATLTRIGDTAASFLDQNTANDPTWIAPVSQVVDPSRIWSGGLAGVLFPPHSLTVIAIQGK